MKISIKYPGNLLTKPVLKELLSFKKCSHNNLAVARIFSKPLGFEKATKSQSILRMKFLKSPSTSKMILKSRDFKRLKISQIFSILKSRDFKRLKISQIFRFSVYFLFVSRRLRVRLIKKRKHSEKKEKVNL
ncbi:MAG: hypothetical protein CVT88_10345 [Candidatus Altiarchaeales archaeon HGW-Altiarchaeales-1]|nr:MAG: hypothetical protein CVT88_10345 [Candidatus Altiarchaeales archaeon HGW-Altiarchaeales-1]